MLPLVSNIFFIGNPSFVSIVVRQLLVYPLSHAFLVEIFRGGVLDEVGEIEDSLKFCSVL